MSTKTETIAVSEQAEVNNVTASVEEMPVFDFIQYLSAEQVGALEQKYTELPVDSQAAIRTALPEVSNVVNLYVIRMLRKEANGKLVSKLKDGWKRSLVSSIPYLDSPNPATRSASERDLVKIAEEMPDAKVASSVLSGVKSQLIAGQSNAEIISKRMGNLATAAKYFGLSLAAIK